MMKKLAAFLITTALVICVMSGGLITAMADEPEVTEPTEPEVTETVQHSTALFVYGVTLKKDGSFYKLTYTFDKPKSVASEAKDITSESGELISVNGKAIGEMTGATVATERTNADDEEAEPEYCLVVTVPESEIKADDTNTAVLSKGYEGAGEFVTTVRYMHSFAAGSEYGMRVYRSDNTDDYEAVSVTSVTALEIQSNNASLKMYLSDAVVPKKMIDMSVRDLQALKGYHGDGVTDQPCYSNAELDMYYDYGIISEDKPTSLLYMLMFGCEKYNGLKMHPANHWGKAEELTAKGAMDPYTTINGIDVYNIYQIQEQVADDTCKYINKDGSAVWNGASWQPLCLQIHMEDNSIQFVFKGDSIRDRDLTSDAERIFAMKDGVEPIATDATSFKENIKPDQTENLVIGIRKGFMFPNGKMIKEDVFFSYNADSKTWSKVGTNDIVVKPDNTLGNQEGYTSSELKSGGCNSSMSATAIPFAVALLFGAGIALGVNVKKSAKESK